MEIQNGKGPWASPISGIVPLGSTLTMVVAINDLAGMTNYYTCQDGKKLNKVSHYRHCRRVWHACQVVWGLRRCQPADSTVRRAWLCSSAQDGFQIPQTEKQWRPINSHVLCLLPCFQIPRFTAGTHHNKHWKFTINWTWLTSQHSALPAHQPQLSI